VEALTSASNGNIVDIGREGRATPRIAHVPTFHRLSMLGRRWTNGLLSASCVLPEASAQVPWSDTNSDTNWMRKHATAGEQIG
jgi:hypothetical protein